MQAVKTAAKVSGAVAVLIVAYRGFCLYRRNDVTVSITELVRLPPPSALMAARRSGTPADIKIQGKVEVETCVMRSYRFLLKLAGHVRNSVPHVGPGHPAGSSVALSRNRVLSLANRSMDDDDHHDSFSRRTISGSYSGGGTGAILVTNTNEMVDVWEVDSSGNICFSPACIMDDTLFTYEAGPSAALLHPSNNTVTSASSPMASPHSASDGPASASARNGSSTAPAFSTVLSTALTGGADGGGNVFVRHCYLSADAGGDSSRRNGMSLNIEVEVANPVHGLQLVVKLPHKGCRMLRANTGGVGRVRQPFKASNRLIWEIGTIEQQSSSSSAASAAVDGDGSGGGGRKSRRKGGSSDGGARDRRKSSRRHRPGSAQREAGNSTNNANNSDDDVRVEVLDDDDDDVNSSSNYQMRLTAAAAYSVESSGGGGGDADAAFAVEAALLTDPALAIRLLLARCQIIYEQPTDAFSDENTSSDDDGDDSSDKDGNNSNENGQDYHVDDEDSMFASVGRRKPTTHSAPASTMRGSKNRRASGSAGGVAPGSPTGPQLSRLRPRAGSASAQNQSAKAARREAKAANKKEQQQQRRREQQAAAVLGGGRGASTRLPTVEVTYSASGLASGTSVRKLQVVSERVNWQARSVLDRLLLQRLLPGLEDRKLHKFAHYTTWFVQPIPVSPV